jgi:hypothetical protein
MPVTLRQTVYAVAICVAFMGFGLFIVHIAWNDRIHQEIRLTHRTVPRLISYTANRDELILRWASFALFGGFWLWTGFALGYALSAVCRRDLLDCSWESFDVAALIEMGNRDSRRVPSRSVALAQENRCDRVRQAQSRGMKRRNAGMYVHRRWGTIGWLRRYRVEVKVTRRGYWEPSTSG